MTEYEFMFGDTWCLIAISAVEMSGEPGYKACPYVLGYRARSLQAVGDRHGTPLEFAADSEIGALAAASRYMEDRFGPRRVAPAPTTSYVARYETSGFAAEPPLPDDRPDPIMVVALERIRKGDHVIVTRDGAKLAPRKVVRMSPGACLANAVEDIDKGRQGRVREVRVTTASGTE